jgi:hypothetical protein
MRPALHARRVPLVLCVVALPLAACGGASPAQPAGEARASGAVVSADTAASQIAGARCDRERECGAIGAGRTYEGREQCTTALLGSAKADLTAQPCPSGIAAARLADCTGRLRQESCQALSTLTLMSACRPEALCLQTTARGAAFWAPAP